MGKNLLVDFSDADNHACNKTKNTPLSSEPAATQKLKDNNALVSEYKKKTSQEVIECSILSFKLIKLQYLQYFEP